MASPYIPPHLRGEISESPVDNTPFPNSDSRDTARAATYQVNRPCHTINEIHAHFDGPSPHSTLNDAAGKEGELAYIILFLDANPKWKSDKLVFAKTNLELLPGYEAFKKRANEEEASRQIVGDVIISAAEEPRDEQSMSEQTSVGAVATEAENDQEEAAVAIAESYDRQIGNDECDTAFKHELAGAPKVGGEDFSTTKDTSDEDSPQEADIAAKTDTGKVACHRVGLNLDTPEATDSVASDKSIKSRVPVPAFIELKGKISRKFRFNGYFAISKIDYIKPKSQELVRMLELKFEVPPTTKYGYRKLQTKKERDPAAWAKSLSVEWAIIKLEKIRDEDLPPPEISLDENEDSTQYVFRKQQRKDRGNRENWCNRDKPVAYKPIDPTVAGHDYSASMKELVDNYRRGREMRGAETGAGAEPEPEKP